jgi:perosamine synthetase
MTGFRIHWAQPHLSDEEIDAVTATLRDRRLSMGAGVAAFEAAAAALVDRRHAIAVANGTVALDVAIKLAGVRPGDEVLVSGLSYIATVNCIVAAGAQPVFCDVDPATLNLDPEDAAARVTPRTRTLLVADYAGSPVDYGRLEPLCAEHGLTLLVDGAQSLGARYRGRPTCSLGLVATTSFHTAKAMITGEGGMVFCDDERLETYARRLRGQGEIPGRKYVHDVLGSNLRLTDVAAAIGRVQLSRAEPIWERRAQLCARYAERLAALPEVRPTAHLAHARPAWFSYAVRLADRDRVAGRLAELGVETRSLYPVPAYRQPIPEYRAFRRLRLREVEAASAEVLNLPLFYEMTDDQVDDVVDCLAQALRPTPRRAYATA